MRAEPIHHGVHPPPPPLRRRIHACPPPCRREHKPPKATSPCEPPPEAPAPTAIPFWRYLEKHNREDRVDLNRTAVSLQRATDDDHCPAPRRAEHDRTTRVYAANPMPRIGEVLDRLA